MPLISKKQAIESGIPKKTLQTILIPNVNSIADSRTWLKEHHYSTAYWRKTKDFRRWMQTPPIKGASYYSRVLDNGVILVFQEY
jgi:hypothetical protein